jgi:CubicO group peptidase (beta-lactamase class C family)
MILQQLMLDATGRPVPQLMQDLVLDNLGLKDSTFEQTLRRVSRVDSAASGHSENGESIPRKWNVLPEMALGGLWTTPSDLGRMAMEVALPNKGNLRVSSR